MRVHTSGAEPEIDFTGGLKKRNIREFLGGVLTNAVRSTVFRGNVDRGSLRGCVPPAGSDNFSIFEPIWSDLVCTFDQYFIEKT